MGNDVRTEVRNRYARTALGEDSGCGCGASAEASCCGGGESRSPSERLGYGRDELSRVPAESDMGLGCGNPTAIGELRPGETVVDLGSGGGIDCFLASGKVGTAGRVIGIDMTPEMIDRARAAAAKGPYENVEFRLGEIENLPVADGAADVVISNCVINLSPDKRRVFREALRVLKPGGRLLISDIVLLREIPEKLRKNVELWTGCVSGAARREEYLAWIREAGFSDVQVVKERNAGDLLGEEQAARLLAQVPGLTRAEVKDLDGAIASIEVKAVK